MKFELTTEQINQILNALAQQPYIQVHELINTIQQQGQSQLQQQHNEQGHTFQMPTPKPLQPQEELVEAAIATEKNGKK